MKRIWALSGGPSTSEEEGLNFARENLDRGGRRKRRRSDKNPFPLPEDFSGDSESLGEESHSNFGTDDFSVSSPSLGQDGNDDEGEGKGRTLSKFLLNSSVHISRGAQIAEGFEKVLFLITIIFAMGLARLPFRSPETFPSNSSGANGSEARRVS